MPTISVVVPFHNTQDYLERCLLSLVRQTHQTCEIICVDDASQDGSIRIANSFARSDGRVKLIRHDRNLGAGGARNTGIRAARSDYVAFVDSDDYADNDLLARALAGTQDGFFDVVCFGYRSIDSQGRFLSRAVPPRRDLVDAASAFGHILMTEPHPWNKVWRRSLFTENGIWFPENMYWEDLATVPRLMIKAKSITFMDRTLYSYLDRQNSTVNRVSDQHILDYFRSFDLIKDFLIAEGRYERDQADFEEIIRITLSWYAEKIAASPWLDRETIADNVRFCGLIAKSYLCADDLFRGRSAADNIAHIRTLGRIGLTGLPEADTSVAATLIPARPTTAPARKKRSLINRFRRTAVKSSRRINQD